MYELLDKDVRAKMDMTLDYLLGEDNMSIEIPQGTRGTIMRFVELEDDPDIVEVKWQTGRAWYVDLRHVEVL